ncbi:hypothetical protein BH23PLA1_BH23PLA1_16810 [soil metagenome]
MSESRSGEDRGGIGSILGWLLFPIVPVLLARLYYQVLNFLRLDPRRWETLQFVLLLGPLLGYGFLAGATMLLAENDRRGRGIRALLGRRAVWVGVGPWVGFLFWAGIYYAFEGVERLAPEFAPKLPETLSYVLGQILYWTILVTLPYGWLVLAVLTLRKARRLGRTWPVLRCGLLTALGFVGSLIGGFWAATEVWRSYFFDPRVLSTLIVGAVLLPMAVGCASQETVGDVRRRELFEAMLLAWVLGLALIWRWWSRKRGPG